MVRNWAITVKHFRFSRWQFTCQVIFVLGRLLLAMCLTWDMRVLEYVCYANRTAHIFRSRSTRKGEVGWDYERSITTSAVSFADTKTWIPHEVSVNQAETHWTCWAFCTKKNLFHTNFVNHIIAVKKDWLYASTGQSVGVDVLLLMWSGIDNVLVSSFQMEFNLLVVDQRADYFSLILMRNPPLTK